VDIAQWATGMDRSGPTSVEVVSGKLPVPFDKGYPTVDDCFNTPTTFQVKCLFENGVEMIIRHDTDNGILFEGEKGRFFVNRGKLVGTPTEWLKDDPIPEEVITWLHGGKPLFEAPNPWTSQMANFVQCLKDRSTPVSDVYTNQRILSTCHLPPGEHRHAAEAETPLGSGEGRLCGRRNRQQLGRPSSPQPLRHRDLFVYLISLARCRVR
jgi:hypothetical protein